MSTGATIKIGSSYMYRHYDGYFKVTGIELLKHITKANKLAGNNGDSFNTNLLNLLIRDYENNRPNYCFTDSINTGNYLYEVDTANKKMVIFNIQDNKTLEKIVYFNEIDKIVENHDAARSMEANIYKYLSEQGIPNVRLSINLCENGYSGSISLYDNAYRNKFNKCAELAANIKQKFNLWSFIHNEI